MMNIKDESLNFNSLTIQDCFDLYRIYVNDYLTTDKFKLDHNLNADQFDTLRRVHEMIQSYKKPSKTLKIKNNKMVLKHDDSKPFVLIELFFNQQCNHDLVGRFRVHPQTIAALNKKYNNNIINLVVDIYDIGRTTSYIIGINDLVDVITMNIQEIPTNIALELVEKHQNIQKNEPNTYTEEWKKSSKILNAVFPILAERQKQGEVF